MRRQQVRVIIHCSDHRPDSRAMQMTDAVGTAINAFIQVPANKSEKSFGKKWQMTHQERIFAPLPNPRCPDQAGRRAAQPLRSQRRHRTDAAYSGKNLRGLLRPQLRAMLDVAMLTPCHREECRYCFHILPAFRRKGMPARALHQPCRIRYTFITPSLKKNARQADLSGVRSGPVHLRPHTSGYGEPTGTYTASHRRRGRCCRPS